MVLGFLSFFIFSFFLRSDFFTIKQVEIVGNSYLTKELLLEQGGVADYRNLFAVKSWEIEKKLKQIPQVKEAKVEKIFPGSLQILIEERRPFALVEVGGYTFWVDSEGVALPVEIEPEEGLVKIWMNQNEGRLLQEALQLAKIWYQRLRFPLLGIKVEDEKLFILQLQNGIFIKCQNSKNLEEKLPVLAPLLEDTIVRSLQVGGFDLRAEKEIFIIPSEENNP